MIVWVLFVWMPGPWIATMHSTYPSAATCEQVREIFARNTGVCMKLFVPLPPGGEPKPSTTPKRNYSG